MVVRRRKMVKRSLPEGRPKQQANWRDSHTHTFIIFFSSLFSNCVYIFFIFPLFLILPLSMMMGPRCAYNEPFIYIAYKPPPSLYIALRLRVCNCEHLSTVPPSQRKHLIYVFISDARMNAWALLFFIFFSFTSVIPLNMEVK